MITVDRRQSRRTGHREADAHAGRRRRTRRRLPTTPRNSSAMSEPAGYIEGSASTSRCRDRRCGQRSATPARTNSTAGQVRVVAELRHGDRTDRRSSWRVDKSRALGRGDESTIRRPAVRWRRSRQLWWGRSRRADVDAIPSRPDDGERHVVVATQVGCASGSRPGTAAVSSPL
jgi:hypothetical protein